MSVLCFLIFVVTLIAFIVYVFKKYKAKKVAGNNYKTDEKYINISKTKRIIGVVCVISFIISLVTAEPAPKSEKIENLPTKTQQIAEDNSEKEKSSNSKLEEPKEQENKITQTEIVKQEPPMEETRQKLFEQIVTESCGADLKLSKVQCYELGDGNINVTIECDGKIIIDNDKAVKNWERASTKMFARIHDAGYHVNNIIFSVIIDVVDKSTGEESKRHAFGINLYKDKADTVKNWENVDIEMVVGKENIKRSRVLR